MRRTTIIFLFFIRLGVQEFTFCGSSKDLIIVTVMHFNQSDLFLSEIGLERQKRPSVQCLYGKKSKYYREFVKVLAEIPPET